MNLCPSNSIRGTIPAKSKMPAVRMSPTLFFPNSILIIKSPYKCFDVKQYYHTWVCT